MSDDVRHLYTIHAGDNFLKRLAQHLVEESARRGEALSTYRILLPTRRTCRMLRNVFLDLNDGQPILLPQMMPLGEVDEEELSLLMMGQNEDVLHIPPAISPLRRRFLLTRLIQSATHFVQGADQAFLLADALGRFMDRVIVEDCDFQSLESLVPAELAEHWQLTLDFLQVITQHWPKILAEEGVVDAATRRNMLLKSLAAYWQKYPPQTPVIVAGSTGSIPASCAVLDVVSTLPRGGVVFQGLDVSVSDDVWCNITESHPQHMLKKTLERIGVTRDDVQPFPQTAMLGRTDLATQIMLPAENTKAWADADVTPDMLEGLEYYSCRHQQEEAAVIGIILRQSLEVQGRVAALVTPDRALARRVSAYCQRWGIAVDDSAGHMLLHSEAGQYFMLVRDVLLRPYSPIALLALLKSPYCRFGLSMAAYRAAVTCIEVELLRQDKPINTLAALLQEAEAQEVSADVVMIVKTLCDSCVNRAQEGRAFKWMLQHHLRNAELFAARDDRAGAEMLWRKDDGESLAYILSDILDNADLVGDMDEGAYCVSIQNLLEGETVRVPYGVHPRLLILGQFEARLAYADTLILGGLNEGTWPSDAGHDPWMSRPMRRDFGLPLPEQSIGIAAHDFVQHFCAPHVVMTRSEMVGGSPAVMSRWLERLNTVLQSAGRRLSDLSCHPYKTWVAALDDHAAVTPFSRPAPRPPAHARLTRASVTKIETWLQNPYALYMHYILKLKPLRPLVQDNDAAIRGAALHKILEVFVERYPDTLPSNMLDELDDIAQHVLSDMFETQTDIEYWKPRLASALAWFAEQETRWRAQGYRPAGLEAWGEVDFPVRDGVFKLVGKADRIDRLGDDYAIIDYKTGGSYSVKAMKDGRLPQMPLEALMLAHGGFAPLDAGESSYCGYWVAKGGHEAGQESAIRGDLSDTLYAVEDGLKELVAVFQQEETPFYAVPNTQNAPRFNDYEHISRLKEWAALDDGGGDE